MPAAPMAASRSSIGNKPATAVHRAINDKPMNKITDLTHTMVFPPQQPGLGRLQRLLDRVRQTGQRGTAQALTGGLTTSLCPGCGCEVGALECPARSLTSAPSSSHTAASRILMRLAAHPRIDTALDVTLFALAAHFGQFLKCLPAQPSEVCRLSQSRVCTMRCCLGLKLIFRSTAHKRFFNWLNPLVI